MFTVILRQGQKALTLAPDEFAVNTSATPATISFVGLHPATTAWLTGASVTVEVFAAAQVFNANGTAFLHDGGQQVLHDRREPVIDANGNVATYQASSVMDVFGGLGGVGASFVLELSEKPSDGHVTVVKSGTSTPLVSPSDYTFNASTNVLTLSESLRGAVSALQVSYTGLPAKQ